MVEPGDDGAPVGGPDWCCSTAEPAASAPTPSRSPTRSAPGRGHRGIGRETGAVPRASAPTSPSTTATRTSSSAIKAATDGAGADVILDIMGAPTSTATSTRWPPTAARRHRLPGRRQGRAEHRQADRQARRGHRDGAARPPGRRARRARPPIVAEVVANVWPMIADGRVRPIIGAELPIERGRRGAPAAGSSGEVHRESRFCAWRITLSPARPARGPAGPPRPSWCSAPGRA